jgi:hypothetical protein
MLNRLAKSEDIQRTLPCRQQTIDLETGHLWAHSHLGPRKKDQLKIQDAEGISRLPHYFHLLTGFERNFVKLNNSVCVNGKKRECEPIHL